MTERPHRETIEIADATLISVEHFDGQQCIMRFDCPAVAEQAQPGQFVHLRCEPGLAMRRPMSIMRSSSRNGWFDILFKIHGSGTAALAARRPGEHTSVLGPIGRPFKRSGYRHHPLLIGGGVGLPPMVGLAEHLRTSAHDCEPLVLLGSEVPFPFKARPSLLMVAGVDAATIAAMPLLDDWGIASRLASLAGYPGCHEGYVTDLARQWIDGSGIKHDDIEIFACGPTPMLRAVQTLAAEYGLPCELSLEEYMACAVSGCAGCTVAVDKGEGIAMKRVCVDGPVFEAASIRFDG